MSVARSSLLFSAGTLLSRFSGLIRDMVLLGIFGASSLLDAFIVAFRIPNLMREMLAEGALSSSFTKVFSQLMAKDEKSAYRLFVDSLVIFSIVAVLICALGVIFAPELVAIMSLKVAEGQREYFTNSAIGMTRILFPYLGLTMMASIIMGALHEKGNFFLSAVSPIAFNIGFILGAWILSDLFDRLSPGWLEALLGDPKGIGLAVGVLIGGVMQLMIQLTVVIKPLIKQFKVNGLHINISPELRQVFTLMVPAVIAASAGPVNVFVNTNFATALGEGAVTWLNASFRLLQLPIGLFGVAVGVAVLPAMSRALKHGSAKVSEQASRHLQVGIELVFWLMVMCFVFLLVNHLEIVTLLYRHGNFSEMDAEHTANALFAYSFGVVGYGLIKVFTSFYYAAEKTKFAMKVALFSIIVNFIGNYILVDQFGYVGLALTSAVTLSFNALVLGLGLMPAGVTLDLKKLFRSLFCLAFAALSSWLSMSIVRRFFLNLDTNFHTKVDSAIVLVLTGVLMLGMFTLGASAYLKSSPLQWIRQVKKS